MTPDNAQIDGLPLAGLPPDVAAEFDSVSPSLPRSLHNGLHALVTEIVPISCEAATAFLKTCPFVFGRIGGAGIAPWCREGLDILRKSEPGGIAYFRLEMGRSVQLLDSLSPGVSRWCMLTLAICARRSSLWGLVLK